MDKRYDSDEIHQMIQDAKLLLSYPDQNQKKKTNLWVLAKKNGECCLTLINIIWETRLKLYYPPWKGSSEIPRGEKIPVPG